MVGKSLLVMKLKMILFLLFFTSFSLTCPPTASADLITVTIASNTPWTNTGILVAEGDFLEIWVSGIIIFGDPDAENQGGPDGNPTLPSTDLCTVTDPLIPQHSAVGNIALDGSFTDGAGFYVGSHFAGWVPISGSRLITGYLYLGYNDEGILPGRTSLGWGFTGDNHGSFLAQIQHSPAGSGSSTPEPSSLLLLGGALTSLGIGRCFCRRKRSS